MALVHLLIYFIRQYWLMKQSKTVKGKTNSKYQAMLTKQWTNMDMKHKHKKN